MKNFIFLLAAFALFASSFAASSINVAPKKATEIFVPMANNLQISLQDLSVISVKDFQLVSGKKFNFFQKVAFKAGQRKLKNGISADGTITNKKLIKAIQSDNSVGFHIGGFALGFLVGLIGILIAYLIKGDPEVDRNRIKWAWIGFGAWLAILVALLLTVPYATIY